MKMNTNKKIAMLLSNGFRPDPRVYQEAVTLVKNGFGVTIYAWDRERNLERKETISGIQVKRIRIPSTYGRGSTQLPLMILFWVILFMRLIFKRWDILHCHDFDTLPVGYLLSKIKRKKIIYDSHESYPDMLGTNVNRHIRRTITFLEDYFLHRVDLVITVGDILADFLRERGAKRVVVIGNWKSIEEFEVPQELVERKRTSLNLNGKFVISYIGFLNEDRRVEELISAVNHRDDIKVLIGGLGSSEDKIREQIAHSRNSIWLGYVKNSDIPLFTALSDALYYCLNTDLPIAKFSAPNKLFEAIAAGKPIIALNVGEIGKIIEQEGCGIFIDSLDKNGIISSIDKTIKDYQQLSAKARELGQTKYNWQIGSKKLLNSYYSL